MFSANHGRGSRPGSVMYQLHQLSQYAALHLRELRDINAQKVYLVLLCKNSDNSSTVCI